MRRWLPHVALCALLALELAGFVFASDSDREVSSALAHGSVEERLDALHIAANRGEPEPARFGEAFVRGLLAERDDRLKEVVFTLDVCKFGNPELQTSYLKQPGVDTPHWWRSYVIHHRKVGGYAVGGGAGLDRKELLWTLDAMRDLSPPMHEVIAHLRVTADQSRRRQSELGITPGSERSR